MDTEIWKDIFVNNFATWVVVLSLLFILIGNKFHDKYTNLLFYLFLGTIVLLDIADITDFYYFNLDYVTPWRYVGSISGYILRSVILVLLILILLRREKRNKAIWLIWIPLIIEIVFVSTTPFTHLVYYIREDNQFMRGPIGYLPHFISGIYLIVLIVFTFIFSSRFDRTEVMTVCFISLFAIAATIFESIFSYKFLITAALAISCLVYYLYFYVRQSRIDELTGVYNRQCFFSDIEKIKHNNLFFVMTDFNGLKQINDTKGHAKGDEALATLANCLTIAASNKNTRVYRVGGDEFTVVIYNAKEEDVKEYVNKAHSELKKTPCMASFGYSSYKDGDSFDECLKHSDVEMYKDKNNNHEK